MKMFTAFISLDFTVSSLSPTVIILKGVNVSLYSTYIMETTTSIVSDPIALYKTLVFFKLSILFHF